MSSASPVAKQYITEQEYLEGEKISEIRHEYIDGKVYAMAGSNRRHNNIALNLSFALKQSSRGTSCEVFSSDLKVRINQRKSYYYPDVLVSCDEDDNQNAYYIDKPCLIVEVLSKSTEQKDYREKLLAYQTIASLQHYMIVAQDRCYIDLFYRKQQGDWWIQAFESMDDVIKLSCPDCEISLAEIYDGIQFD